MTTAVVGRVGKMKEILVIIAKVTFNTFSNLRKCSQKMESDLKFFFSFFSVQNICDMAWIQYTSFNTSLLGIGAQLKPVFGGFELRRGSNSLNSDSGYS